MNVNQVVKPMIRGGAVGIMVLSVILVVVSIIPGLMAFAVTPEFVKSCANPIVKRTLASFEIA